MSMPKHEVLRQFSKIINDHNPMSLPLKDIPDGDLEYEAEALSILSRFTEAALYLCDDQETAKQITRSVVRTAFEFWFSPASATPECLEALSDDLYRCFMSSYAPREQNAASGVVFGS